jgi:hypothetical protein
MRSSAYNRLEQCLHWLALEPRAVRELSFDLERRFARPGSTALSTRAVYVCGLARSGTTVVLRALARSDAFRSLTYRDMPFVLAPNLWRRFTRHTVRPSSPAERAHGDGIMVDFDSPEAFEEVFWRTYCPQPAGAACYGSVTPTADAMEAFAEYRAVVAGTKRYLSKNNNNLVRLDALARHGGGTIVVVYRQPLDAARSLHRQHQRFCAAQRDSPFTRSYMAWLGHHEFGLDHKPFCLAIPAMREGRSAETLDYWLEYWAAIHEHAASHAGTARLVDYDAFCRQPARAMEALMDAVALEGDAASLSGEIRAMPSSAGDAEAFDPQLVERAHAAHAALTHHANNIAR